MGWGRDGDVDVRDLAERGQRRLNLRFVAHRDDRQF